MKRILLFLFLLMAVSLACEANAEPLATPTPAGPNPAEIAATMLSNQVAAAATGQTVNLQLPATANVIGATQTAQQAITYANATQQARNDVSATEEQKRLDAVATDEQKRSDIAATQTRKDIEAATEQARIDMQNTQSALATKPWDDMTKAAVYPHATLTQMAVNNAIVLSTHEVARSGVQLKQLQDTNVIQWLIPTVLAILACLVGAAFIFNLAQVRVIQDGDGNIKLVIFKNKKAIRPNLMPRALLELGEDDVIDAPAEEQAEVTKRAQAIDALEVMPVNPTQAGVNNFNSTFGPKQEPRFGLLSEGDMPPAELINSDAIKAIEGDWKDSNDK